MYMHFFFNKNLGKRNEGREKSKNFIIYTYAAGSAPAYAAV